MALPDSGLGGGQLSQIPIRALQQAHPTYRTEGDTALHGTPARIRKIFDVRRLVRHGRIHKGVDYRPGPRLLGMYGLGSPTQQ